MQLTPRKPEAPGGRRPISTVADPVTFDRAARIFSNNRNARETLEAWADDPVRNSLHVTIRLENEDLVIHRSELRRLVSEAQRLAEESFAAQSKEAE